MILLKQILRLLTQDLNKCIVMIVINILKV